MNISLIIGYPYVNPFDIFLTDRKGLREVDLVFSGEGLGKAP
jgi:hypothetical protein